MKRKRWDPWKVRSKPSKTLQTLQQRPKPSLEVRVKRALDAIYGPLDVWMARQQKKEMP